MNIVLIGYRGTGKTVVGKRLAQKLHRPFYDTDTLIEKREQTTIADMVKTGGWTFFRKVEKDIIRELSETRSSVIATGGGAVMDKQNVSCLNETGVFVLLTADPHVLVQRILADQTSTEKRPPLSDGTVYEEMQTLLTQRMPTYQKIAQFSVDTTGLTVDEVVAQIVNGVKPDRQRTNFDIKDKEQ